MEQEYIEIKSQTVAAIFQYLKSQPIVQLVEAIQQDCQRAQTKDNEDKPLKVVEGEKEKVKG